MDLRRGLEAVGLMTRLSVSTRLKTPQEITDFALASDIIKPLQVRHELRAFASLVAERRPKTILEIGTCRGGTLFVLSRLSHPEAMIISIDLPGGPFGGGYSWFHMPIFKAFAGKRQSIHLLREDSHAPETKDKVAALLNGTSLDLLFIDGDHTYTGVKADFEMYSPLVKSGMIVLHDVAEHPADTGAEVSVFWKEIKQRFPCSEIIADRSQGWAGIGILSVSAPSH